MPRRAEEGLLPGVERPAGGTDTGSGVGGQQRSTGRGGDRGVPGQFDDHSLRRVGRGRGGGTRYRRQRAGEYDGGETGMTRSS
ncbi:hypothetical protein [Streptomyces sp. SPB162]|uniref:hypothetical protein n=1 Tax=Streptomyces sp. SPB162 TaxID=2940560 RepID=UPI0024069059|nr:hypothetical protein [Streptomyces sp. SPB162]MDF9816511.1 hypothetical protein [Streptomyces sp. SPB162]